MISALRLINYFICILFMKISISNSSYHKPGGVLLQHHQPLKGKSVTKSNTVKWEPTGWNENNVTSVSIKECTIQKFTL